MAKFKKILQEQLEGVIPKNLLPLLPKGFQQVGDKAILTLNSELTLYRRDIGRVLLHLFKNIKGIYVKRGAISGKYRQPQLEFIIGENKPEIIHREHGISYKFDITKIMFSKGNINERLRISKLVKTNEVIYDLFAGIGYFSLLVGHTGKPKKVYAFEINPVAYQYLVENIQLNKINEIREIIIPILGDSNIEALKVSEKADRVIMGILPAPKGHVETVYKIIKDKAIVHYEGLLRENQTAEDLLNDFKRINEQYSRKLTLIKTNFVKSYGPKIYHVTLDLLIN